MFKKISNMIIILLTILLILFTYDYFIDEKDEKKQPIISIGFAPWPGFDVVYYAQEKHIFEKIGLDVNLIRYPDQESATKALQNLEIDAAMISIWDVLHITGKNNFDIILTTNVSNGADGIVASGGIKSIKDLKGKKISSLINSVNELILLEALELNDMNMSDLDVVNITNEEALPKLFHEKIDAAVLWEPLLSKTKRKIDGNILFTTKEVDSLVIDLLVVQSKSIKEKSKEWHNFLISWYQIMDKIQTNPQEVFDIVANKTNNIDFAKDYEGLNAGTISLNKEMFLNNRLKNSMDKVSKLIAKDVEKTNIYINSDFIKLIIKK